MYNILLTVPELDDSPERKLELLYGVTLPDWCVHGTDLPGIYKEITEKTSDACDVIDTNRLFPILMASNLPRDQLGHIWNRANQAVPGQLNLLELRIVLGLVALGQVCRPLLLQILCVWAPLNAELPHFSSKYRFEPLGYFEWKQNIGYLFIYLLAHLLENQLFFSFLYYYV